MTASLLMTVLLTGCLDSSNNRNTERAETTPEPVSDNAALESLTVSEGSLDPTFAPSVLSYSVGVDNDVATISVTPSTADPAASVSVQGETLASGTTSPPIDLAEGSTSIQIVTTAENGSTETYTISVVRASAEDDPMPMPSSDATLRALMLSATELNEPFDPEVTDYTADVDNSEDVLTVTATVSDGGATLTINGVVTESGQASDPIALQEGDTEITLMVIADDASTMRDYRVMVTRADAAQSTTSTATLLVLDQQGVLVSGAEVTVDGTTQQVSTGEDGRVDVTLAEQSREVIRIRKAGFLDQTLPVTLPEDAAPSILTAALMRREAATQITDVESGGTATGSDGASVTLPPGALVDASGQPVTGTVDVFLTPVDVSDERALRAFPGGFEARSADGVPGFMLTLGTVDFTFEQNGEPLALTDGHTAEIELPLYITRDEFGVDLSVGQVLPFWFLDEAESVWLEEAQGMVVASASSPTGLAVRGEVNHFSWWNLDKFALRAEIDISLNCESPSCSDIPGLNLECATVDLLQPLISGRYTLSRDRNASTRLPVAAEASISCIIPTNAGFSAEITPADFVAEPDTILPVSIDLVPNQTGGRFFPGLRLRGLMTEVGETHVWTFEGFRGFVLGVTAYPAQGPDSEPALTGGLAARVSVFVDGVELDGANFESAIPGELSVTLPEDGQVEVRFEAQGKLPGWYVATTRIVPPAISGANGEVAFVAGTLPARLYTVPEGTSPYLELSGTFTNETGALGDARGVPGAGPEPRDKPLYREATPGTLVYVADQNEPLLLELYRVDLADPGNSTRLNGPEVDDGQFAEISRFEIVPSDPSRVVYSVGEDRFGGTALYLVDLDDPGNPVRLAEPSDAPFYDGRQWDFSLANGGSSVVYQAGSSSDLGPRGHLYLVDLDTPDVATRLSAAVDTAGGETLRGFKDWGAVSDDGSRVAYTVQFPRPDGNNFDRRLFVAEIADPGSAVEVAVDFFRSGEDSIQFTPDASKLLVIDSAGQRPWLIDVSDPSATPVRLGDARINPFFGFFMNADGSLALGVRGTDGPILRYDLENPGEAHTEWRFPEPDGAVLQQLSLTGDGSGFVALVWERNSTQRRQLYLHEFAEPSDAETRLGPSDLVEGTDLGVAYFDLAADGEHVYYLADTAQGPFSRLWQIERTTLSAPDADRRLLVEALENTPIQVGVQSTTGLPGFLLLESGQNP